MIFEKRSILFVLTFITINITGWKKLLISYFFFLQVKTPELAEIKILQVHGLNVNNN